MKRNIYTTLPNAKQELFAIALAVFSFTAYSQATYTYSYTGSAQTLVVQPGSYSIQCWGANGGDGGNAAPTASSGGKGGYTEGTYSTAATTTLYIYVGGMGQSNGISASASVTALGGWNGGGGGF